MQISELILLSVKSTAKFSLTSTATEQNHYMQNLSFFLFLNDAVKALSVHTVIHEPFVN